MTDVVFEIDFFTLAFVCSLSIGLVMFMFGYVAGRYIEHKYTLRNRIATMGPPGPGGPLGPQGKCACACVSKRNVSTEPAVTSDVDDLYASENKA